MVWWIQALRMNPMCLCSFFDLLVCCCFLVVGGGLGSGTLLAVYNQRMKKRYLKSKIGRAVDILFTAIVCNLPVVDMVFCMCMESNTKEKLETDRNFTFVIFPSADHNAFQSFPFPFPFPFPNQEQQHHDRTNYTIYSRNHETWWKGDDSYYERIWLHEWSSPDDSETIAPAVSRDGRTGWKSGRTRGTQSQQRDLWKRSLRPRGCFGWRELGSDSQEGDTEGRSINPGEKNHNNLIPLVGTF